MKITDYKLVRSGTGYVEEEVNILINNGWQPFGSLQIENGFVYQAMVKWGPIATAPPPDKYGYNETNQL